MEEILNAYDQKENIVKKQERKSLLKEIEKYSRENGDANYSVDCIYLLLQNPNKDFYVVKRGDKPENPNRYDKTVGGHVQFNETHLETLYRETKEEIGVDVIFTKEGDFEKLLNTTDLTKYAVIKQIDFQPYMKSIRAVRDGEPWFKRHRVAIYSGVYDGKVEFLDGEATGLQLLSKNKILDEIKKNPENFTYDLGLLLTEYSKYF